MTLSFFFDNNSLMIIFSIFTAGAEPIVVSSSVDIVEQSGLEWVHIAETSRSRFSI